MLLCSSSFLLYNLSSEFNPALDCFYLVPILGCEKLCHDELLDLELRRWELVISSHFPCWILKCRKGSYKDPHIVNPCSHSHLYTLHVINIENIGFH